MANFSDLTRREQVLARLGQADGGWVDGPELANEVVGGSEGLRRLRELADEGHNIRKRRHPDPMRDIFQYRLGPRLASTPPPEEAKEVLDQIAAEVAIQYTMGSTPQAEPAEKPVYPTPRYEPQTRISTAIKRKEDGTFEYVPPQRPIHAPEQQLTALPEASQPEGLKYDEMPKRISWGATAVCPRCKQKTARGRTPKVVDETALTPKERRQRERKQKEATRLVDEWGVLLFKDPTATPTQPCRRCNGYGIVPNVGPIALTLPDG